MSVTIRISELGFVEASTDNFPDGIQQWDVEVAVGAMAAKCRICNPFSVSPSQTEPEPEKRIAWYLEEHTGEPFEASKADAAADLLTQYGQNLALQLAATGLLPATGHLQVVVLSPPGTDESPGSRRPSLQSLHWEALEDVSLWPLRFRLSSVSTIRSLTEIYATPSKTVGGSQGGVFNILLVVARPHAEVSEVVDYQLVAKSLMAIVDHVSKSDQSLNVSLTILRPPTWKELKTHLKKNPRRYDLVHLDMNGRIRDTGRDGDLEAVVEFCKPCLQNPLRMEEELINGDDVGEELAKAGVRTVVLNSCDSAKARDSTPKCNFAASLLRKGIESVLAMAYKVMEEAVEIFMSSFYQSLLAEAKSVQDAARVARSELLRNKSRRARHMYNVHLLDYIVPVVYTSVLDTVGPEPNDTALSIQGILGGIMQLSPLTLLENWIPRKPIIPTSPTLLGRSHNILSLEALLSLSRLILLHGQGSVGKTALLRYACEWWKSSGWIDGAAYIDFGCLPDGYSMGDVVECIAGQLNLGPYAECDKAFFDIFRDKQYLLLFDSAEAFDSSISTERIRCSQYLPRELKRFVHGITGYRSKSKVIIASRLETTSIADVPNNLKYRLPGLSALASTSLLEKLLTESGERLPEKFYRRENIDFVRRVAIILEGNPEAIRLMVPEMKRADYDGEALLHTLLYGACQTIPTQIASQSSRNTRFMRSLRWAPSLTGPSFINTETTFINVMQLAPFWNIMPRDLSAYYWFLNLDPRSGHEGSSNPTHWLSDEFRDIVAESHSGRDLHAHWPDIEDKLIRAGILSHATITKKNCAKIPCYHLHPLFTLVTRAAMPAAEEVWTQARFAFVWQSLLWDPDYRIRAASPNSVTHEAVEWSQVGWDGRDAPEPEHSDHLYNWRLIAMAWSVQDVNAIKDATDSQGNSLFDYAYRLALNLATSNPRQAHMLIPHLRAHIRHTLSVVNSTRPNRIPTRTDLHVILFYSWTLWRLESDVLWSPVTVRQAVIAPALEAFDRWAQHHHAGGDTAAPPLNPWDELSHHQLRYAAATTAEDDWCRVDEAKKLFQRHLAMEPVTADPHVLEMMRRCFVQSLHAWSVCVLRLALGDKTASILNLGGGPGAGDGGGDPQRVMGDMLEELIRFWGQGPPRRGDGGDSEQVTMRDVLAFSLYKEPEAEGRFSPFVRKIVDGPAMNVVGDVLQTGDLLMLGRETEDEHGDGEIITPERLMEFIAQLFGFASRPGQNQRDPLVGLETMRDEQSRNKPLTRYIFGDITGAMHVMMEAMMRGAPSSTESTAWQQQADRHIELCELAMAMSDYRKGLAHMKEWWNLHRGIGLPRLNLCWGWVKFAICHHKLGQLAEAVKAVIRFIDAGHTLRPEDCILGRVDEAQVALYSRVYSFKKLNCFYDPRVIISTSPALTTLSLSERVRMHGIMTYAKHVVQKERRRRAQLRKWEREGEESRRKFEEMKV